MNIPCLLDKGPLSYAEADGMQCEIHAAATRGEEPDILIVWQAEDIYTAGRCIHSEDAPDPSVPVVKVDHDGSVTYHRPGQVIVYPIVHVRLPKDVVAFVHATEVAVIEVPPTLGARGERIAGRSGVWAGGEKICIIGLKFASDTIMHDLALDVTTDVSKFFRVDPCRITDAGVTFMEWQGVGASLEEAAAALMSALGKYLTGFRQER